MPAYVNPQFSEIAATTRENRSAEHGNLFTKTDPSKVSLSEKSPTHPIISAWNGKYATRKPPKRINNVKVR